MNIIYNLIINTYAIILLLVIGIHAIKHADREALDSKLYLMIVWTAIFLLVMDICGRMDGNLNLMYPILNHTGNFMIFALNTVLPSLWMLYVYYQIYHDTKKIKYILYPLIAVGAVNLIIVILTLFFGGYYNIDAQNIYHRGPLYLISPIMSSSVLLAACIMTIASRKKINRDHFSSLLFFAALPFLGILIQAFVYGYSLTLICVVPSLIIVYLNVQSQTIHTDYLTGANNRKGLEKYLKDKIDTSSPSRTFSAIMLDLDDFKYINDTFGHDTGDTVLRVATKVFRSCIRSRDYIARFGGDEFYIVLDISNQADLETAVQRINNSIAHYNLTTDTVFKLGVSMGYAVYNFEEHLSVEQFQKKVDKMMYKNKREKQTLMGNANSHSSDSTK